MQRAALWLAHLVLAKTAMLILFDYKKACAILKNRVSQILVVCKKGVSCQRLAARRLLHHADPQASPTISTQ